jgi:hypothetical protein
MQEEGAGLCAFYPASSVAKFSMRGRAEGIGLAAKIEHHMWWPTY